MFRVETKTKSIWQKLAENWEYNAPLLNVVERNCHEEVKMIRDSVCIRDKISGTYLFSPANWDELKILLEDVGEKLDSFMINTAIYHKEVLRKFPLAITSEYEFYVINKKDNIHRCRPSEDIKTTSLDSNWLNFILDRYKDKEFGHESYISDRILNGLGLGLQYKGEKAAFVLQHKNGETGALVVEEKYRRRGLGGELLKRFNRVLFEKNTILFALVEKNNIASASTMVNGGYKKVSTNIIWVYRRKNGTLIPRVGQGK